MKQCPRCRRIYRGDDLSFCLDDGTPLIKAHDPEATQISPFMPSADPPPTVAYVPPPATQPAPAHVATHAPTPAPEPRSRSLLAVGATVVAVLAVGLAIGAFAIQRYSAASVDAPQALPTPRYVAATATTPTPAPTTTVTPVPTPAAPSSTPLPAVTKPTPAPAPDCILYNDKADKAMVTVRSNCDTQDCDNDASTKLGDYPNDTPVRVVKGSSVRGQRFTWVKVVFTSTGQTAWVASAKIKCN